MATNADRRIALQFAVEQTDSATNPDKVVERANKYANFLSSGTLGNETPPQPEEPFDPLTAE